MKSVYTFITSLFLLFTVALVCGNSTVFDLLPDEVAGMTMECKNVEAQDSQTTSDDLSAIEESFLNNSSLNTHFLEFFPEKTYFLNIASFIDIHLGLSSPPPEQA